MFDHQTCAPKGPESGSFFFRGHRFLGKPASCILRFQLISAHFLDFLFGSEPDLRGGAFVY
jgi:hypothetical protein